MTAIRLHLRTSITTPVRRLLSIPLALALALLLASLAAPTHAAGSCTVTPGKGTYPTVNSATSGASGAACSTVILPAGTFSEQVTIDHPLTLTGAGAGKTTILHPTPGPTTKSVVQGSDAVDYVLDVTAPGVTISKLTVDGHSFGCHTYNTCGSPSGDYQLDGIALQARNFTLDSAAVQNVGNARQQGYGYPIGGQAAGSGDQSVTLKNSAFRSFTGLALMRLQPEPSPFIFMGNTVTGSSASQFGLVVFGEGAQITHNTFSGFHHVGAVTSGNRFPATIALFIGGSGNLVSGNSFSNDDTGVLVAGAGGAANTIAGNTFQNTQGAVLLGLNTAGQIVRDNIIGATRAGNGPLALGAGILLCQEGGDKISGNTITRSVYGVAVLDSTRSQCGAPAQPNNIWNNLVSRSSRFDLYDETRGGDTGGTLDTYSGNTCRTSSPKSLCGARSWRGVLSPNPGDAESELHGVAAISSDDMWAVGEYLNSSQNNAVTHALAEHWNGAQWSAVAMPNSGSGANTLSGVSGSSASDVWAVGSFYSITDSRTETLVERWDGMHWKLASSPSGSGETSALQGVAAVSLNNAWAVGYTYNGGGTTTQLIEHWNGSSWSIFPAPDLGGGAESSLSAVTALSPTDIWAVGGAHAAGPYPATLNYPWYPLVEHWNGTSWSVAPSPNPGPSGLSAIAAHGDGDIWVVGSLHDTTTHYNRTFAMHWNGAQWIVAPTPSPGSGDNTLMGVAMLSDGEAWAVGVANGSSGGSAGIVEHWDGHSWQLQQLPPINSNFWTFTGAVATSRGAGTDVWAVGWGVPATGGSGSHMTLVEHY